MKSQQSEILIRTLTVICLALGGPGAVLGKLNGDFNGEGYRIPSNPDALEFPQAHGSHPDFRLEWWYLTGHLYTETERRFAFQATFFRYADPPEERRNLISNRDFGAGLIHLAHMAILDTESGEHAHRERINREGWDAVAKEGGLDIRNGNWSLRMTDETRETLELRGTAGAGNEFTLELEPEKPRVFFGEHGLSLKGEEPTSRSYYISFPRLRAEGSLSWQGERHGVSGRAWMDHEISSGQLTDEQIGWDWAGIQLDDGREIMTFQLRRKDGAIDPFSYLGWVDRNGELRHYGAGEFHWELGEEWESPETGARYPLGIVVVAPDPELDGAETRLTLKPLVKEQEFVGRGGLAYWEGACDVLDRDGEKVGTAFVEMTGYAGSLQGRL